MNSTTTCTITFPAPAEPAVIIAVGLMPLLSPRPPTTDHRPRTGPPAT